MDDSVAAVVGPLQPRTSKSEPTVAFIFELGCSVSSLVDLGSETAIRMSDSVRIASTRRGISAALTPNLKMCSRTVATSTTSSIFIPRASSRSRGSVLSQRAIKAGTTHWSIVYLRARTRRSYGVGGSIDSNANLRRDTKPQRVDRSRTDFHCSYDRSRSSKLEPDVYASISGIPEKVLRTHWGYKIDKKASKSLHSTSPNDRMVDKASWSRTPSWANRVEKYTES